MRRSDVMVALLFTTPWTAGAVVAGVMLDGRPSAVAGLSVGVVFWLSYFLTRRGHRQVDAALDVAAARRESHALSLPFPEADGSLSRKPESQAERDRRVHAELHARRWSAEEMLGAGLRSGGPASPASFHWSGCRCLRGYGEGGRVVILSPDPLCRPLRSR